MLELGSSIRRYQQLSGKQPEDVLLKQGGKLAFALMQNLRGLAPEKGAVREERLQALKSGEGVKVRPRVRNAIMRKYSAATELATGKMVMVKGGNLLGSIVEGRVNNRSKFHSGKGFKYGRINLQALMVKAELNTRESGRGFLGVSARYPKILQRGQDAVSRYGVALSTAALNSTGDELEFEWNSMKSELSGSAAKGITEPRGMAAVNAAIQQTIDDIEVYNNRKTQENLEKAGLTK